MASRTITFGKESSFGRFLLELDDDQNAGKTTFQPAEDTCYVRLYPAGAGLPTLQTNMGTARIETTGLPREITEDIVFTRTEQASFYYPCSQVLSWQWLGRTGPTPRFTESDVILPEKFSGILRLTYKAYYDRIVVSCAQEGHVLLEAIKDDRYGYIVLEWVHKTRKVYLTVKDACSRTIIAGAQVYIDGQFVGVTDKQGRIYFGELKVGKHFLRVCATGYQCTDEDNIANDEFTIPE